MTETFFQKHPNLLKASLLVCLANGGINRFRSKEDFKQRLDTYCERFTPEFLSLVDSQLEGLTDEELEVACDGEHEDIKKLMASRTEADQFLNVIFEQVV